MKHRITLSIVLALSMILLTLTSSASKVQAQNNLRFVADSGIVTLGPDQELRVSVAAGDVNGDDNIRVRFTQIGYNMCNASPKLCEASRATSNALTVMQGEAASFTCIPGSVYGVRGVVRSSRPDARIVFIVFDTSTQRVVSFQSALVKNESLSERKENQ
jgi:hypothetical protein